MIEKKDLYLAAKAKEVWLCDEQGNIKFYSQEGEMKASLLVPNFPNQINRKNRQRQ